MSAERGAKPRGLEDPTARAGQRAPSARRRRSAAFHVLLATLCACAARACTSIPTSPLTPFSLGIDSIPSPSVVAGDTMRDTTGVATPLSGRAYNVQGQLIKGLTVRFLSLTPTQLTVAPSNFAIGAPRGDSIARVVADAQGLQSLPFLVPVVLRPDSLLYADSDSISTLTLTASSPDSNISVPLTSRLKHIPDSLGGDSVTRTYLVHYKIIYPASAAAGTGAITDTTLFAYLVNANSLPQTRDTTDVTGLATQRVVFNLLKIPAGATDSVVVVVNALYRTAPVPRSPLRFVIHYISPHG